MQKEFKKKEKRKRKGERKVENYDRELNKRQLIHLHGLWASPSQRISQSFSKQSK